MKMHESILKRVRMLEQKNGIAYMDTDSSFYKTFRIFFIIAFCYGIIINLFYIIGMILIGEENSIDFYKYILTPAICSVLMFIGFILELKKINVSGAVFSVVPAVVLALFFKNISYGIEANAIQPMYYWRHLAPMAIIVISSLVMSIIAIRANVKLKKMYIRVVNNIYSTYKVNISEDADISSEQWDEFLKNFNPNDYSAQFLNISEKEKTSD